MTPPNYLPLLLSRYGPALPVQDMLKVCYPQGLTKRAVKTYELVWRDVQRGGNAA